MPHGSIADALTAKNLDAKVSDVETDTQSIESKVDTVDSNVDAILVDTGTTLPATLSTIDTVVDRIEVDTQAIETDTQNIQSRIPSALVGGRIDATIDATGFENEAVDKIWDEDATGHSTTGTFGAAIGDPGANTENIYDAVVTDAAGTNIAADIIVIDGIVDTINSNVDQTVSTSAFKKTASTGTYTIPSGPTQGIAVASSTTANAYNTTWTEMTSSASADLYILGFAFELGNVGSPTYVQFQIGTGAAASESVIAETLPHELDLLAPRAAATNMEIFPFPIPVSSGTRIAMRCGDQSTSAVTYRPSLLCINQADLSNI